MYPNLDAEMARKKVRKTDISKLLKVRYATILDKLNGNSRLYYDEAKKIKDNLFPESEIEYLFEKDESQVKHRVS